MATITRNTKTGGGTDLNSNESAVVTDLNPDFNTIFNEINGNLENVNIKSSADIDPSKVGDYSDDASTSVSTSSPGTSGSESLATDLEGELERLRYKIEELALGLGAARNDGSSKTAAWIDTPVRPGNLLFNGSFELHDSGSPNAPDGWTLIDTPGTVELTEQLVSEGEGKRLRVEADAATTQGVQQTLAGLKANTKYLVGARFRVLTGTAHLTTTGADSTGEFRNLDLTSTSSSGIETLKGVIKTDSTPTDIVLKFTTDASATDDFTVDHAFVQECNTDPIPLPNGVPVQKTVASDQTLTAGAGLSLVTGLLTQVTVPCPGCWIEVYADVFGQSASSSASVLEARIVETGSSGSEVRRGYDSADTGTQEMGISLSYVLTNPTVGQTYEYKVQAQAGSNDVTVNGGDAESSLLVILRTPQS